MVQGSCLVFAGLAWADKMQEAASADSRVIHSLPAPSSPGVYSLPYNLQKATSTGGASAPCRHDTGAALLRSLTMALPLAPAMTLPLAMAMAKLWRRPWP